MGIWSGRDNPVVNSERQTVEWQKEGAQSSDKEELGIADKQLSSVLTAVHIFSSPTSR